MFIIACLKQEPGELELFWGSRIYAALAKCVDQIQEIFVNLNQFLYVFYTVENSWFTEGINFMSKTVYHD